MKKRKTKVARPQENRSNATSLLELEQHLSQAEIDGKTKLMKMYKDMIAAVHARKK